MVSTFIAKLFIRFDVSTASPITYDLEVEIIDEVTTASGFHLVTHKNITRDIAAADKYPYSCSERRSGAAVAHAKTPEEALSKATERVEKDPADTWRRVSRFMGRKRLRKERR